jgi:hypothetical protein
MTFADHDARVPPVVERATRLRNAAVRHCNDPTVVNIVEDAGKAFIARANASELNPLQAFALVTRLSASLGLITHCVLRERNAQDPDFTDLQAFTIAYASLIGQGIEELAPLAPDPAPPPAGNGAAP